MDGRECEDCRNLLRAILRGTAEGHLRNEQGCQSAAEGITYLRQSWFCVSRKVAVLSPLAFTHRKSEFLERWPS